MGSPLGSVMGYLESNWLSEYNLKKPKDMLIAFQLLSIKSKTLFFYFLNKKCSSITFLIEKIS